MKSLSIIGLVALVCMTSIAFAQPSASLTPAQNTRYQNLTAQFRCVVCQDENIANSAAPMAADMRAIVARQVQAGRSDRQIKSYMVERYGDFILYDPPFGYKTLVLWLGPFALLLFGLGWVIVLVRRRGSIVAVDRSSSFDRARLDRLLSESEDSDEPSAGKR